MWPSLLDYDQTVKWCPDAQLQSTKLSCNGHCYFSSDQHTCPSNQSNCMLSSEFCDGTKSNDCKDVCPGSKTTFPFFNNSTDSCKMSGRRRKHEDEYELHGYCGRRKGALFHNNQCYPTNDLSKKLEYSCLNRLDIRDHSLIT